MSRPYVNPYDPREILAQARGQRRPWRPGWTAPLPTPPARQTVNRRAADRLLSALDVAPSGHAASPDDQITRIFRSVLAERIAEPITVKAGR